MFLRALCSSTLFVSFLFQTTVYAEPDDFSGSQGTSSTAAKKIPKAEMETLITGDKAENSIEVSDSLKWAPMMREWMSDIVTSKFKNLPIVSSLQMLPGSTEAKVTETSSYQAGHTTYTRESQLVVKLQLGTPISLMFDVSESKVICSGDSLPNREEGEALVGASLLEDTAEAKCRMRTSMTLKGPTAVYGTFAGQESTTQILRDEILVNWSLATDYTKKDSEISASFKGRTARFQNALVKMLELAQFKPVFEQEFAKNPVRPTLKYISGILRTTNEEIMKGQL